MRSHSVSFYFFLTVIVATTGSTLIHPVTLVHTATSTSANTSIPLCSATINDVVQSLDYRDCLLYAFPTDVNPPFAFTGPNADVLCRISDCRTALDQLEKVVSADCTIVGVLSNTTVKTIDVQQLVTACKLQAILPSPTPPPSPTPATTLSHGDRTLMILGIAAGASVVVICVIMSCVNSNAKNRGTDVGQTKYHASLCNQPYDFDSKLVINRDLHFGHVHFNNQDAPETDLRIRNLPVFPARYTSTLIHIGKTSIYRTGPSTAKVGILAFPDIFGLDSGRAKQDADRLGALGYAVAFVDLTYGEYAHDGWDREAWIQKQDFETVLLPRIRDVIAHLRTDAQVHAIASYGYCYGAWVGARLSAEKGPLIQGHVSFHPSWVVENMLYGEGKIEALAHRVLVPQLLLSAENDRPELKEGGTVHQILREQQGLVADKSRVVDFPHVQHGWVNRGDISDAVVRASATKAWDLARAFLEEVTTVSDESTARSRV